ncbi:MAG: hypothetical protein P8Y58_16805 [Novosphingobium sp.]
MGTGILAADSDVFDPGFAIAARQAYVVGHGLRITPVAQDDIDVASREPVNAVRDGVGAVGVDELLEDKALSDATWDALSRKWDEAQLIEFPMMVGEYAATACVRNILRIRLVKDNPGSTCP